MKRIRFTQFLRFSKTIQFPEASACYVQNIDLISFLTGERNSLAPVGKEGSAMEKINAIEKLMTKLKEYLKTHPAAYYEPVDSILDLLYNFYTETNPAAPKETAAGRAAKQMHDELAEWLKVIEGMDRMVEDYGLHIQLWEDIMDHVGSVNCAWERTAFEEGVKTGIRLMMEVGEV